MSQLQQYITAIYFLLLLFSVLRHSVVHTFSIQDNIALFLLLFYHLYCSKMASIVLVTFTEHTYTFVQCYRTVLLCSCVVLVYCDYSDTNIAF